MRLSRLAAVGGLVLTLVATGCTNLVFGDSLVAQAAVSDGVPMSIYGTAESNVDGVVLQGASGSAPCDWIGARSQSALDKYHPSIISFSWSGNALTSCMRTTPVTVSAVVAKYRADLVTLTNWWTARNVKVILSAPLCPMPGAHSINGDPAFRFMESSLAGAFRTQGKHVAYSEYAAQTICPAWVYYSGYRDPNDPNGLHLNATGAKVYALGLRYESKHTTV